MITIATFSKPEEAHMLRLRLEAGGVSAFLQDENLVQTDWLLSNAVGGVRVQILEDDLEQAKAILADPPIPSEPAMAECPRCRSRNSEPDEGPRRLSFFSLLLAGFPFLVSKTRWHCRDCGRKWNEANREKTE